MAIIERVLVIGSYPRLILATSTLTPLSGAGIDGAHDCVIRDAANARRDLGGDTKRFLLSRRVDRAPQVGGTIGDRDVDQDVRNQPSSATRERIAWRNARSSLEILFSFGNGMVAKSWIRSARLTIPMTLWSATTGTRLILWRSRNVAISLTDVVG